MPTDLTADDVGALERRMAAATSVDSVSVDKDVLAALIEGWRTLQAMRCETCKHWRASGYREGWGCCQRTLRHDKANADSLAVGLTFVPLDTAVHFGCVQREPTGPAATLENAAPNEE